MTTMKTMKKQMIVMIVAPLDVHLVAGPSVEHAGHALLPPLLGCHAEVGTSFH